MASERWVLGGGVLISWGLAGLLFVQVAELRGEAAAERSHATERRRAVAERTEALEKESAELRAALAELQEVWEAGDAAPDPSPAPSPRSGSTTVVAEGGRGVGIVVQPRRRLQRRLR